MEDRNEFEIDLVDLLYYLKKKFIVVVAACLVGAVLGFVVSTFFITPQYKASTTVYVLSRNSEDMAYSDIQISTQLVNDFKALIKRRNVTKQVIEALDLDLTHSQLTNMISVTSESNTRVLTISVTDTDAQRAADIANKVREFGAASVMSIMDLNAVKLVDEAIVPVAPSSPNVSRYTLLFAAAAAVLAAAVLVVIRLLDDTIRTEDDVERYLGLATLGVIPASRELDPTPKAKSPAQPKRAAARPVQKQ